jgi:tetratricopeptide (TPR) repeat protein
LRLKSFKTSPPNRPIRRWEIRILAYNHHFEEFYDKADKFIRDYSKTQPYRGTVRVLFLKYALQGQKAQALASVTEDLKEYSKTDEQESWTLADCYALIGEKEEAIRWLEIAVSRGFVNYPFISKYDPFLENIRGEERFKKLMERVKYEWEHFEE